MKNAKVHFIKLKMKSGEILELLRYPTHDTKLQKLPIHNTDITYCTAGEKYRKDL